MVSLLMSPNPADQSLPSIRRELLDLLTQAEDFYPWNPTDAASDAYFDAVESQFPLTDALDTTVLETNADRFFAIANQVWQSTALNTVKADLWEKFACYIPSARLDRIFDQAQALAEQNLSTLHQLVECVKPLWSQWHEDDLNIIARPLAVAMRGSQGNEVMPKPVGWDELTEIEQIRLTMLAAQEVLTQLKQAQE